MLYFGSRNTWGLKNMLKKAHVKLFQSPFSFLTANGQHPCMCVNTEASLRAMQLLQSWRRASAHGPPWAKEGAGRDGAGKCCANPLTKWGPCCRYWVLGVLLWDTPHPREKIHEVPFPRRKALRHPLWGFPVEIWQPNKQSSDEIWSTSVAAL